MAYDIRNIQRGASGGYGSGGYNPQNIQAMLGAQGQYNLQMKQLMEQLGLNRERFEEQKRVSERAYGTQEANRERQQQLWGFLQGGGTIPERRDFFQDYTDFTKLPMGGAAGIMGGASGRYGSSGSGRYGGGANYGNMSPMAMLQMARSVQAQGSQDRYFRGQSSDMNRLYQQLMEMLRG